MFQRLVRGKSMLATTALAGCTLLLTACADGGFTNNIPRWGGFGAQQRTAPPPQPAAQPAVAAAAQAAPTEVQLACVQAVATRVGGPPGSVTPAASTLIRQDTFKVDMNTASGPVSCIADAGGNILAVEQATAATTQTQQAGQAQGQRLFGDR